MIVWYDRTLCPPPDGERVLVVCRGIYGKDCVKIGTFKDGIFEGELISEKVTHWMKLPKLP